MNLDNAPKPFYLSAYEYKYGEFKLFSPRPMEIRIDDSNLLESFMSELSDAIIKNMGGVEYLKEEERSRNETYYNVSTQYKDSNGRDLERPYIFEKMYFSNMRLYKNGELIIENYIPTSKCNFLFFNYRTELYKVTLSQELTNQIIELYEN